jgi:hypothetical protein
MEDFFLQLIRRSPSPNVRRRRGAIVALILLCVSPAVASAMPGQTNAQFSAWAKANPALHGLTKKMGEMSGMPYYSATFAAGSAKGTFMANVDGNSKVSDESVAFDAPAGVYDILKHPETAKLMLTAVYGAGIATDLTTASKEGTWTMHDDTQATTLYRGKLFGYELAHTFVKLIPVAAVAAEAKLLATCAKTECGD